MQACVLGRAKTSSSLFCFPPEEGFGHSNAVVSLDDVYDCRKNRKAIFNRGMVPNINANPRGRKISKGGHKPLFLAIFKERFHMIERVFGWEDKFRRLLLRFERLSQLHYAFKALANTMINLRLLGDWNLPKRRRCKSTPLQLTDRRRVAFQRGSCSSQAK